MFSPPIVVAFRPSPIIRMHAKPDLRPVFDVLAHVPALFRIPCGVHRDLGMGVGFNEVACRGTPLSDIMRGETFLKTRNYRIGTTLSSCRLDARHHRQIALPRASE